MGSEPMTLTPPLTDAELDRIARRLNDGRTFVVTRELVQQMIATIEDVRARLEEKENDTAKSYSPTGDAHRDLNALAKIVLQVMPALKLAKHLTDAIAASDRALAGERVIEERCPKTRDGLRIYHGMTVFVNNCEMRVDMLSADRMWQNDEGWAWVKDCYSTREAALRGVVPPPAVEENKVEPKKKLS